MQYKLKNISDKEFNFEGVVIPPHGVSEELSPEIYQRLLALYYGTVLMPIDDPSYLIPDDTVNKETEEEKEEIEEEAEEITEEVEENNQPQSFVCEICGKTFNKKRDLTNHIRLAHKEGS